VLSSRYDASMSDTPQTAGSAYVPPVDLEQRIHRIRTYTALTLLALIALGLAWELWLAPLRPGGSWLVLKVLPLCIPLAGILKQRMYTYRWLSLMVWLYFTEGVVRATSDRMPSAAYAAAQVVLCVVLFVLCAWHVRLRLGPRKKRTGPRHPED
jgi:uncharacterized membrane protein